MIPNDINSQFVCLLLQNEPQLYAWIRVQIPNRADAEDVLQETVTTLWAKFSDFQPNTNFLSWALSVAYFEVRRYYRKQSQQKRLFSEAFVELTRQAAERMAGEASDVREALAACMEKLTAADRNVVRRCYQRGATIAAVAAELDRPFTTIKNALRRSRRRLYECIQRTLKRTSCS
jgi:RNA polymerase sigma-70 factor (ECF subfamily)